MVVAMIISVIALQESTKSPDETMNYGYHRYNIIAGFVNTTYVIFNFIFDFIEQMHHIVEHWD